MTDLDLTNKEMRPIVYVMIIFFIVIIGVIILKSPDIKKRNLDAEKKRIAWINEFVDYKINTISIVTNKNIYHTGDHGLSYGGVNKLYINKTESSPEELLNFEDLFINHCGIWYCMYHPRDKKGCDSIVYKFSAFWSYKETYNIYGQSSGQSKINSIKNSLKHYKYKLPKCWD